MLVQKLKFNPHLVWSDQDGFHVFGYRSHRFYHMVNEHVSLISNLSHHAPNTGGHFNKALKIKVGYILMRPGNFGVLTAIHLEMKQGNHHFLTEVFGYFRLLLPIVLERAEEEKTHRSFIRIPLTSNFDQFENKFVFAWGRYFVFWDRGDCKDNPRGNPHNSNPHTPVHATKYNPCFVENFYFPDRKACTDAKFSRDGNTVAVSVGNSVRFFDVASKTWKKETLVAPDTKNIHYLSYNEEGNTLATVTTCCNLIVWDL